MTVLRNKRGMRWLLASIAAAALAGSTRVIQFLRVDACLDHGGVWDYTSGGCRFDVRVTLRASISVALAALDLPVAGVCFLMAWRKRPRDTLTRTRTSGWGRMRGAWTITSRRLTKDHVGVAREVDWVGIYNQFANRLATLHFLLKHGVKARLVFIHFCGDHFPDGRPCPASEREWQALIEARSVTLGLPKQQELLERVYEVFLACRRRLACS